MEWWQLLSIILACVIVWIALSFLLYKPIFKRFYDILLSGIAIILLAPVYLVLAIAVRVKLGAPVIFVQRRPGKNNKIFKLHKFRTMTDKRDENGELLPDESRLTRFGSFLRSSSLDELPELWDIFRGKMSIVGPRPQLIKDMVFMSEDIKRRHCVRPGLTGLAQVNGRNNISWESKFEYDLEYVGRVSLVKDIAIIFKTVGKVLKRSDINREGAATDVDYGDWLLGEGRITQEEYDEKILLSRTL